MGNAIQPGNLTPRQGIFVQQRQDFFPLRIGQLAIGMPFTHWSAFFRYAVTIILQCRPFPEMPVVDTRRIITCMADVHVWQRPAALRKKPCHDMGTCIDLSLRYIDHAIAALSTLSSLPRPALSSASSLYLRPKLLLKCPRIHPVKCEQGLAAPRATPFLCASVQFIAMNFKGFATWFPRANQGHSPVAALGCAKKRTGLRAVQLRMGFDTGGKGKKRFAAWLPGTYTGDTIDRDRLSHLITSTAVQGMRLACSAVTPQFRGATPPDVHKSTICSP